MARFSIKWLLMAVAYVALSIAALLNANDYWRQAFDSAALFLLLTAMLGTILSAGQQRAFWTGWLVFGTPWILSAFGLFVSSREWTERLVTTGALDSLHEKLFTPTIEVITQEEFRAREERFREVRANVTLSNGGNVSVTYVQPSNTDFVTVGNASLRIPYAVLGGVIATWFWRRREAQRVG